MNNYCSKPIIDLKNICKKYHVSKKNTHGVFSLADSKNGFHDLSSFAKNLRGDNNKLSKERQRHFSANIYKLLEKVDDSNLEQLGESLVEELNNVISGKLIYDEENFSNVTLSEETSRLLEKNPKGKELGYLNRLLLEDAYPFEITSSYALKNINLEITQNESIGIIGRSGSGKSTLLNIMATLDNATSGEYIFKGNPACALSKIRREMGFVFQTPFMLSNFDVRYNISLPNIIQKKSMGCTKKDVNSMLGELDLSDRATYLSDMISGGQRQRVAIGRALIHKPSILFADEPTGSLDEYTSYKVMRLLKDACNGAGSTFVLITHNTEIAKDFCERIIGISNASIMFDLPSKDITKDQLAQFIKENNKPTLE